MSLRLELIILPAVLVFAGLATLLVFEVNTARDRIQAETKSALEVGQVVAIEVRNRVGPAADGEAVLAAIEAALPDLRHVRFSVMNDEGANPVEGRPTLGAPAWFARLIAPPERTLLIPVEADGVRRGQIQVTTRSQDEVLEIWGDVKTLAAMLAVLSVLIVGVVITAVSLALRPLKDIAEGFDRLERSDFDVRLRPLADAEFRNLGRQFNSLVEALGRATQDNRLLIDRLMSVQEAERKEIAHELHDEIGPTLFGIRAELSAILAGSRNQAVRARVRSIAGLVDQIQRLNSRLLARMRPLVLEQMGLAAGLEQMVQDWRARHPAIAWGLACGPEAEDLPEEAKLALYRAVQECLTNAVRHAEPGSVDVDVRVTAKGVRLRVSDDGRGMASGARFGFGLLGMGERARALGGGMTASANGAGGCVIEVTIPRKGRA